MGVALAPVEADLFTALGTFLQSILPAGTPVVQAQINRVPEPAPDNFVTMNTVRRERIETNVDNYADVSFTGSIAGTVLTVSAVALGQIALNASVFGIGVAANTTITAFGSGSGGAGTYTVVPSQTVASEKLSAGASTKMQPTKITVQLDVHGSLSADNAQIISTLFRDAYAVSFFEALGTGITPLYADDPKQIPFENAEQQIETRWVIEAVLQANQTVTLSQQFADALAINVVSVDATYPP